LVGQEQERRRTFCPAIQVIQNPVWCNQSPESAVREDIGDCQFIHQTTHDPKPSQGMVLRGSADMAVTAARKPGGGQFGISFVSDGCGFFETNKTPSK